MSTTTLVLGKSIELTTPQLTGAPLTIVDKDGDPTTTRDIAYLHPVTKQPLRLTAEQGASAQKMLAAAYQQAAKLLQQIAAGAYEQKAMIKEGKGEASFLSGSSLGSFEAKVSCQKTTNQGGPWDSVFCEEAKVEIVSNTQPRNWPWGSSLEIMIFNDDYEHLVSPLFLKLDQALIDAVQSLPGYPYGGGPRGIW